MLKQVYLQKQKLEKRIPQKNQNQPTKQPNKKNPNQSTKPPTKQKSPESLIFVPFNMNGKIFTILIQALEKMRDVTLTLVPSSSIRGLDFYCH